MAADKDRHDMSGNQGEGNKGAANAYNDATTKFAHSGKVEQKAREAADAKGADRAEMEKAEADTKKHAKGEDPALKR